MKSKFVFESEDLSPEAAQALSSAMAGIAEADKPLCYELVFLSQEEIKELNARTRGIDSVTDVLSFPSMDGIKGRKILACEHRDCIDEEGRLFLGSIAICTDRARSQAEEYGHSYERELNYLAVHGALHCLGYDHATEEEKREMRSLEETVMARMNLKRD